MGTMVPSVSASVPMLRSARCADRRPQRAARRPDISRVRLVHARTRGHGALLGSRHMYQSPAPAAANLPSLATRCASLFGGPLMCRALQMCGAPTLAGDLALLLQ